MTQKPLKPRREADFYPTPCWVVEIALGELHTAPRSILDTGAGEGVWGDVARERWDDANITGIDCRRLPYPHTYDLWITDDYLADGSTHPGTNGFDGYELIMGNPPYLLAEGFIRRSISLLATGGNLVYLLRLSFLESRKRGDGLWQEYPPKRVVVLKSRPSFTGDNKTDSDAYAIFYWQKGWHGETTLAWAGRPVEDSGQMVMALLESVTYVDNQEPVAVTTINQCSSWDEAWATFTADLRANRNHIAYTWPCPSCGDTTASVMVEMSIIAGTQGGLCGVCASDGERLEDYRRTVAGENE